MTNVGRINWQPKRYTRICSDHFTSDSFYRFGTNVQLHKGAIPTQLLPLQSENSSSPQSNMTPDNSMQYDNTLAEYQLTEHRIQAVKFAQSCVESGTGMIIASRAALDQFLSSTKNVSTKDCHIQALVKYTTDIETAIIQYKGQTTEACNKYTEFINTINRSTVCQALDYDVKACPTSADEITCDPTVPTQYDVTGNSAHKTAGTMQPHVSDATLSKTCVQEIDHAYDIRSKPQYQLNVTKHLDHNYFTRDSPRFLKRKLLSISDKLLINAKRRKVTLQRIRRLQGVVSSLTDVVSKLQQQKLISESAAGVLSNMSSDIPQALFNRMQRDHAFGHLSRQKYDPQLRRFALTLHFYSPKAYQYVRETFKLSLPHPTVVKSWYSSVNGEPGLTTESFKILQLHAQKAKLDGKEIYCNFTMDEMAIRKHVEWDGKRFRGYVDIGTENDDDNLPVATEALVFMVVALDSSWKLPVAYYFIKSMTGQERASVVKECLSKLHNIGINITSLTCDGAAANQSMFTELGASLKQDNFQPWFKHPSDNDKTVHIILDICHMLKLLRNTFASQTLIDRNGGEIKWHYIKKLHELQEREGLRAGNRLRKSHIEFHRQKMKVSLAAQTISSSVAKAMEFCQTQKFEEFDGYQPTIDFLNRFDWLFDILHSRNPFAKNFKAALRMSNRAQWLPFLKDTRDYLLKMTNREGNKMINTNRKTPFVGFIIGIDSTVSLFQSLVEPHDNLLPPLKYLLTYRLSQDHLELFFGCIRSHSGYNNNPTVRQFVATYKRLLVHNQIKASFRGNCIPLDEINILNCNTDDANKQDNMVPTISILENMIRYDIIPPRRAHVADGDDECYEDIPDFDKLSTFVDNAVVYIAGFVVRNLKKHIKCTTCINELTTDNDSIKNHCHYNLLNTKNNGGLQVPSAGTVAACIAAEKCFRRLRSIKPPNCRGFAQTIELSAAEDALTQQNPVFENLHDHMFETEPENNHRIALVKYIVKEYTKIRLYHCGKRYTASIGGEKVRKEMSKLILFKHQ